MADTLLAGLNRLKYANNQIIALSSHWLSAMDLRGQSSLMSIILSSGRQQLVLNRKGCCMHFRLKDGGLCASCPKQKMLEKKGGYGWKF